MVLTLQETIFQKVLQEFLLNLSKYYPEYPDFESYYYYLKNFPSLVPMVFSEFKNYMKKFEKQILEKDVDFFLKNGKIEEEIDTTGIIHEIEAIKNLWSLEKTDEKTKEIIWNYIYKIYKICFIETK